MSFSEILMYAPPAEPLEGRTPQINIISLSSHLSPGSLTGYIFYNDVSQKRNQFLTECEHFRNVLFFNDSFEGHLNVSRLSYPECVCQSNKREPSVNPSQQVYTAR